MYLQAALHADELPGILVLDHLKALLDKAEEEERISGEIVLVPFANPIGLDQHLSGHLMSRFDLSSGTNFNRFHCDYAENAVEAVENHLTTDSAANTALIRKTLVTAWRAAGDSTTDEASFLRWRLYGLAYDADMAFDLHCDWDAVMHLYTSTASWPEVEDVARYLETRAVLLAENSGDNPFDESLSYPWVALRKVYGDKYPIPQSCHSFTIELRGQVDVRDDYAAKDAAALFETFVRRGVIEGEAAPLPESLCEATDLAAVDMVKSPAAGVLVYARDVGEWIEKGEVLGYVVNPIAAEENRRVPVVLAISGILYGRLLQRLVRPGETICKVAGRKILPHRQGKLLTS